MEEKRIDMTERQISPQSANDTSLDFTAYYDGEEFIGFTNVYRSYGGITMTVMMMGPDTFTLQDWDDITNELKQYWIPEQSSPTRSLWPKDLEEE